MYSHSDCLLVCREAYGPSSQSMQTYPDVRPLAKGAIIHFTGVRTASTQDRAALASVAAGFVHFFPRTP